jgi:hypothetical protein
MGTECQSGGRVTGVSWERAATLVGNRPGVDGEGASSRCMSRPVPLQMNVAMRRAGGMGRHIRQELTRFDLVGRRRVNSRRKVAPYELPENGVVGRARWKRMRCATLWEGPPGKTFPGHLAVRLASAVWSPR